MRKLYLLLLFATGVYCQEISYVKTLDTIYVDFKENKFQTKRVFPINNFNFYDRWYTINFGEDNNRFNEYYRNVTFYFTKYLNFQKREMKIQPEVRIVKKSFLRKHKNK